MDRVLEIFYNEIIPEAATGKIECFFYCHILFDTIIEDTRVTKIDNSCQRVLQPTLIIKDTKKFNTILLEYIKCAYPFFISDFYDTDIDIEEIYSKISYLKTLLAIIWSDATSEDFANPCEYLQQRTNFLKDQTLQPAIYKGPTTSIGELSLEIKREQITYEAPYSMIFYIDDNPLPIIRVGVSNKKAYIYAIQNNTNQKRPKKLNRDFYKVNKGIDEKDSDLKDVTPSSLLAATLAVSYLYQQGIQEFIMPIVLPSRWNLKELIFHSRANEMSYYSEQSDHIQNYLKESIQEHERIQHNMSIKFMQTFKRLAWHFSNIEVTALPFIDDINMHIKVNGSPESMTPLLLEMYEAAQQTTNIKRVREHK